MDETDIETGEKIAELNQNLFQEVDKKFSTSINFIFAGITLMGFSIVFLKSLNFWGNLVLASIFSSLAILNSYMLIMGAARPVRSIVLYKNGLMVNERSFDPRKYKDRLFISFKILKGITIDSLGSGGVLTVIEYNKGESRNEWLNSYDDYKRITVAFSDYRAGGDKINPDSASKPVKFKLNESKHDYYSYKTEESVDTKWLLILSGILLTGMFFFIIANSFYTNEYLDGPQIIFLLALFFFGIGLILISRTFVKRTKISIGKPGIEYVINGRSILKESWDNIENVNAVRSHQYQFKLTIKPKITDFKIELEYHMLEKIQKVIDYIRKHSGIDVELVDLR